MQTPSWSGVNRGGPIAVSSPAARRGPSYLVPERNPQNRDWLVEGVEFELSGDFLNGQ
jgi:hypothetical protein